MPFDPPAIHENLELKMDAFEGLLFGGHSVTKGELQVPVSLVLFWDLRKLDPLSIRSFLCSIEVPFLH